MSASVEEAWSEISSSEMIASVMSRSTFSRLESPSAFACSRGVVSRLVQRASLAAREARSMPATASSARGASTAPFSAREREGLTSSKESSGLPPVY